MNCDDCDKKHKEAPSGACDNCAPSVSCNASGELIMMIRDDHDDHLIRPSEESTERAELSSSKSAIESEKETEEESVGQLVLNVDFAPPKEPIGQANSSSGHLIEVSLCIKQQQSLSSPKLASDLNELECDKTEPQLADLKPLGRNREEPEKRRLIYERIDKFSLQIGHLLGGHRHAHLGPILPFKSGTFDACFCFNLLNVQMADPSAKRLQLETTNASEWFQLERLTNELRLKLLRELSRVVKSKGKIMVTVFAFECQQQRSETTDCKQAVSSKRRSSHSPDLEHKQSERDAQSSSDPNLKADSGEVGEEEEEEEYSCCPQCRQDSFEQRRLRHESNKQTLERGQLGAIKKAVMREEEEQKRQRMLANGDLFGSKSGAQTTTTSRQLKTNNDDLTTCDTTLIGQQSAQDSGPKLTALSRRYSSALKRAVGGSNASASSFSGDESLTSTQFQIHRDSFSEAAKRIGRRLSLGGASLLNKLLINLPTSSSQDQTLPFEGGEELDGKRSLNRNQCDIKVDSELTDSSSEQTGKSDNLYLLADVMNLFRSDDFAKRHRQSIAVQTFFTKSIEVHADDEEEEEERQQKQLEDNEEQLDKERDKEPHRGFAVSQDQEDEEFTMESTSSGWTAPTSMGLESGSSSAGRTRDNWPAEACQSSEGKCGDLKASGSKTMGLSSSSKFDELLRDQDRKCKEKSSRANNGDNIAQKSDSLEANLSAESLLGMMSLQNQQQLQVSAREPLDRLNSDFSSFTLITTNSIPANNNNNTSTSTTSNGQYHQAHLSKGFLNKRRRNNSNNDATTTTTTTTSTTTNNHGNNNNEQMLQQLQQQQQRRAFSETEAYSPSSFMQTTGASFDVNQFISKNNKHRLPSNLISCNPADISLLSSNIQLGGSTRQIRSAEPTRYNSAIMIQNSGSATSSSNNNNNSNNNSNNNHLHKYRNSVDSSKPNSCLAQQHRFITSNSNTGSSSNHHSLTNLIGHKQIGQAMANIAAHSNQAYAPLSDLNVQAPLHQHPQHGSDPQWGVASGNRAGAFAALAQYQKQQWCHSNTFSSSLNSDISTTTSGPKDTTEKDSSRRTSTLSGISSIYQQETSLGLATPHSYGGNSTPANSQAAACSNMGSIPELASVENATSFAPAAPPANSEFESMAPPPSRAANEPNEEEPQQIQPEFDSGTINLQRVAQSLRSQLRDKLPTMRSLNALINLSLSNSPANFDLSDTVTATIQEEPAGQECSPAGTPDPNSGQLRVTPQMQRQSSQGSPTPVHSAASLSRTSKTDTPTPATLKSFFRSTSSAAFNAFASSFQHQSSSSTPTATTVIHQNLSTSSQHCASGSISSEVFDLPVGPSAAGKLDMTSSPQPENRFGLFASTLEELEPSPRSPLSPISVTSTRFFARIRDKFTLSPTPASPTPRLPGVAQPKSPQATAAAQAQQSALIDCSKKPNVEEKVDGNSSVISCSDRALSANEIVGNSSSNSHLANNNNKHKTIQNKQANNEPLNTTPVRPLNLADSYDDYEHVVSSRRPSFQRQLDEQVNQVYRMAVDRKLQNSPIATGALEHVASLANKPIDQELASCHRERRSMCGSSDLDSIIRPMSSILYGPPASQCIYLPAQSDAANQQLSNQRRWIEGSQQSIDSSSSARSLRSCWFSMPELYVMNNDSSSQSPSGTAPANQRLGDLFGALAGASPIPEQPASAADWPANQLYKQIPDDANNWTLNDLNLTNDDIAPPPIRAVDSKQPQPLELIKCSTLDDSVCVSMKSNSNSSKGEQVNEKLSEELALLTGDDTNPNSRPTSQNSTISNTSCALSDLNSSELQDGRSSHQWTTTDSSPVATPLNVSPLSTGTAAATDGSANELMRVPQCLVTNSGGHELDATALLNRQRAMSLVPGRLGVVGDSPVVGRRRSTRGLLPGLDVAPAATTLDLRLASRKNRVKLSDLHPITFINDRKFLNSMNSLKKDNDNKLQAIFNSPVGRRLSVNAELAQNSPFNQAKSGIKIGLTGYVYLDRQHSPQNPLSGDRFSTDFSRRRPSLAPNFWRAAQEERQPGGQRLVPGPQRARAASCIPNADIATETEQPPAAEVSKVNPPQASNYQLDKRRSTIAMLEPDNGSSKWTMNRDGKLLNAAHDPRAHRKSISCLLKIGEDEELRAPPNPAPKEQTNTETKVENPENSSEVSSEEVGSSRASSSGGSESSDSSGSENNDSSDLDRILAKYSDSPKKNFPKPAAFGLPTASNFNQRLNNADRVVKNDMILRQLLLASNEASLTSGGFERGVAGESRRFSAINLYQRDEDVFVANSMRRPPSGHLQMLNTLPLLAGTLPILQAGQPKSGLYNQLPVLANPRANVKSIISGTSGLQQNVPPRPTSASQMAEVDIEEQLNRLRQQERRFEAAALNAAATRFSRRPKSPESSEEPKSPVRNQPPETLALRRPAHELESQVRVMLTPKVVPPLSSPPQSPSITPTIVSAPSSPPGALLVGGRTDPLAYSGSKSCEPFKQLDTIIEGRGLLLGAEQQADPTYANRLRRLSGNNSRRASASNGSQQIRGESPDDDWCRCDLSPTRRLSSVASTAGKQPARNAPSAKVQTKGTEDEEVGGTSSISSSSKYVLDTVKSLARRTFATISATSVSKLTTSPASTTPLKSRQQRSSSMIVGNSNFAAAWNGGPANGQQTLPSRLLREKVRANRDQVAERLANKRSKGKLNDDELEEDEVSDEEEGEEEEEEESSSSVTGSADDSSLISLDDAENYRIKNKDNKMKHGRSLESSSGSASSSTSSLTSSSSTISANLHSTRRQKVESERRNEDDEDEDDEEEDEEEEIEAPKVCYKCNKKIRMEEDFCEEEDMLEQDEAEEETGNLSGIDDELDEVGGSKLRRYSQANSRGHRGRRRGTAARRSASMNSAESELQGGATSGHINRRKNKWHIQRNLAPKLKRQRSFSANYAPEVPNPVMPPPRRFSAAPTLSCPHRNKSSSHSSSSLHRTYSIDSSESMITVIPANNGHEFKRASRGSLSCNSGQGLDSSGSFYTLPKSPLSPRSPRCSPCLLTPNNSEPPTLLEPPFSPATTTTTCSSPVTVTVIQQPHQLKTSGQMLPSMNSNSFNLAPLQDNKSSLRTNFSAQEDDNLSLAVRIGTSNNSSRLELDELDSDVGEMQAEIEDEDDTKEFFNSDLATESVPAIRETINEFCARHSREELVNLVNLAGNLIITDCHFSDRSSTLCMVIEVEEKQLDI